MTERQRRAAVQQYWHEMDTVLGPVTLVSDGAALVGVYFAQHRHAPEHPGPEAYVGDPDEHHHPVLRRARAQLGEYLAGRRQGFDLPLDATGTAFQHRVWAALRDIPYGTTRTYGQVAGDIGVRGAARAVGHANGRNPLSIVVPCHRVIGSDGSLSGYGGGARRKQALLDLEREYARAAS